MRASAAGPGDADSIHKPGELRGASALSAGDRDGQDVPGAGHRQVELGTQASARAAQRTIVRLRRQLVRTRPARIVIPFLRAPAAC